MLSNLIGTSKDGKSALGNTIAFNGGDGVEVLQVSTNTLDTTSNKVFNNSIFSNGGLGIDRVGGTENSSGATANDPGDADVGPNNLQNFPVLTSARVSRKATTVRGTLNSTSGTSFSIEFFSNPSGTDAEGKTFIGEKLVTTDAAGNVSFSFKPQVKVRGGTITATATNASTSDTSEFSAPRKVRRV